MRFATTLIILMAGLAISASVWFLSGGQLAVLVLPLLLGLPLLWSGRRR
jgi:hypothetical protein